MNRTRRCSLVVLVATLMSSCSDSSEPAPASSAGDSGAPQDAAGIDSAVETGAEAGPDGEDGASGDADVPPIEDAPAVPRSFLPSDDIFPNPERGFYSAVNIMGETDLTWVRDEGRSLVYSYVRLDSVRSQPITQGMLDDMDKGLDIVRQAGLKLILRFAYNFGPYPNSEPDASKTWILHHIGQVEPYLAEHADVIAVVQAGFIGAWGEWHTSTNNLLDDPADRRQILEALLDAVPSHRMTQIRYPAYKAEMYGDPVDASRAHDGSYASRTGHHNDCFLASNTDMGTYDNQEGIESRTVEEWKQFVSLDTRFLPMGGETCAVSARSECPTAMAEMQMLHFSYINEDYHPDVVAGWAPCRDEMERKLGYRFTLLDGAFPEAVRPGGSFRLVLRLHNEGFAAVYNARPVVVVLESDSHRYEITLAESDPRVWGPGEDVELNVRLGLPMDIEPGVYRLALWLPDGSQQLRDREEYAIRLANDGTWQEPLNVLGNLSVDPQAQGGQDPTATAFAVLSE